MGLTSSLDFARHDPWAVIGFSLIGASGVVCFHTYLRLERCGVEIPRSTTWARIVVIPRVYLRGRSMHGWAAWPAYLVWISAVAGFATLLIGFIRLAG